MTIKELNDLLYQKAQEIGEHFDSVQIIATLEDDDGESTQIHACGTGNLYARVGSCREWLVRNDERTRIQTRKEDGDPDITP